MSPGLFFFPGFALTYYFVEARTGSVHFFVDVVFLERVVSDATLSNAILSALFGMAAKILPGALEVKSNGI